MISAIRHSLSSTRVAALALGASLVLAAAMATPAASTTSTEISLTGDADSALFSERAMKPGQVAQRCTVITVEGRPAADATVLLSGETRGALASLLRTRIEVVPDPVAGSCADAAGRIIYDGPLSGLDGPAPDQAIDTGWRSTSPTRTTYRFTTVLEDSPAAEGQNAEATFRWSLVQADLPSIAPKPDPTREPTATPDPEPSQEPSRGPGVGTALPPAASPHPAKPTHTRKPHGPASRPAAGQPPRPWGPTEGKQHKARPALEARSLNASPGVADKLQVLANRVAKHSGIPLVLLLFVAAFLLIQDRLDRRDPKLALAPVHAPADLLFLEWPPRPPADRVPR